MAGERNQPQLCVYCGRQAADTVDHIPPKLLLARPFPDNLLTVPACLKCNASFQKDDEYTRVVLSVDVRVSDQPVVQSNLAAVLRSLQKQEAEPFARYLNAQIVASTVLGADGMPLGMAIKADHSRVNATGERIIRGLFFVETGRPLATTTAVQIACRMGVSPKDPIVRKFTLAYSQSSDRRIKAIGDAFSYVAVFHPRGSIWLLLLYQQFACGIGRGRHRRNKGRLLPT